MPAHTSTEQVDLKDAPLFKELTSKEFSVLKKVLKEKKVKKGEMLFGQSQSCENIVIVKSGRVKIFRLSSSGQERILEVLLPGETCACNPGSSEWVCSSWAEALTDSSVWYLPRSYYVNIVNNNSRLAQTLAAIFAKKLCRFCSLIEQVSMESPQRRLVRFLIDMLDSKECANTKEHSLSLPFTHEEIAHRLGLVRETVTRQLTKLKKLKLIQIDRKKILICNREALEKILS